MLVEDSALKSSALLVSERICEEDAGMVDQRVDLSPNSLARQAHGLDADSSLSNFGFKP
jgi:hypothetical protein